MAIHIKGMFIPIGNDLLDKHTDGKFMGARLNDLIIDLEKDTGNIIATKIFDDSPKLKEYLNDKDKNLPENLDFESKLEEMYDNVRQLIRTTKFLYGIYRLDTQTRMQATYYWSLDRQTWYDIPDRRKTKWIGYQLKHVLPDPLLNNISIKLEKGWQPFMAFEHLHKGFADRYDTRFQWINGAIAAEQGIKEFLGRFKPELEPILTELPSPPIPKLYKNILHTYTGMQSTYYKALQDGSELRNKLVHKANHPAPTYQETIIYLHTVECALLELHLLLEPDDPFMQYLLNIAINRLNEVKTNPNSLFH